MRDEDIVDRLQLDVPATPSLLATIRLFVASAARTADLGEDTIGDLKLAVSEAASAIITSGHHGTLTVVVAIGPAGTSVEVSPLSSEDLTGDHLHPGDIVRALFPAATLDMDRSALVIPLASGSG